MAKKKQKDTRNPTANLATKPSGPLAAAAEWPVLEVLMSNGWEEPGRLTTLLVARRSPKTGKVAAAMLLIDLACLGIKDATIKVHKDTAEYSTGLRAAARKTQTLLSADFDLAAKVAFSAVEYASSLGFKPAAVYAQALPLFEGANPDACDVPVQTGGRDGKPLFINGPYDDVKRIIAQLDRSVGAGNYHMMIGGPQGIDFFDELEPLDDDEDDDERTDDRSQ